MLQDLIQKYDGSIIEGKIFMNFQDAVSVYSLVINVAFFLKRCTSPKT